MYFFSMVWDLAKLIAAGVLGCLLGYVVFNAVVLVWLMAEGALNG